MKKPQFQHDCKSCQFIAYRSADKYDMYVCSQGGDLPTIVFRFSDEGSDYTSLPLSDMIALVDKLIKENKE